MKKAKKLGGKKFCVWATGIRAPRFYVNRNFKKFNKNSSFIKRVRTMYGYPKNTVFLYKNL